MIKTLLPLGFLALAGCGTPGGDSDSSGGDTDTDDTNVTEPGYSVTWGATAVSLDITDGTGATQWGLAEDGGSSADPWTGEDCLNGYTLGDGSVLKYCHDGSASGAELAYGGNPNSLGNGETVFSNLETANKYSDANVGHYVLMDGSCVVFGAGAASYYSSLGCSSL